MLQIMKRNNNDSQGYGKPSGKSGNYKSSTRNERLERENRSSSNKFFGDKKERSEGSGKPSFNKPKTDWEKNPERSQRNSSSSYGRGRSERSFSEDKPTYN